MELADIFSCDWLVPELGPPPDAILRIPPPPVPHFFEWEESVVGLGSKDNEINIDSNEDWPCISCKKLLESYNLELNNNRTITYNDVSLEEKWIFTALSSCFMLMFGAILVGFIYLRMHRKSPKDLLNLGGFCSETCSTCANSTYTNTVERSNFRTQNYSVCLKSNLRPCETQYYACRTCRDLMTSHNQRDASFFMQRATLHDRTMEREGNYYTITRSLDQKLQYPTVHNNEGTYTNEDSADYTTLRENSAVHINHQSETLDGNDVYYCCTNNFTSLSAIQPNHQFIVKAAHPVTSLDDFDEQPPAERQEHQYINMFAIHPLEPYELEFSRHLVNPIYPMPSASETVN